MQYCCGLHQLLRTSNDQRHFLQKDYDMASKEITKVKNFLLKNLDNNSIILGPTTASMFKVNNIYRFQILIKYKKDPNLKKALKELDNIYVVNRNVNIEIDNNPLQV